MKVIAVVGPTATGKSDVAYVLAGMLGGQIVSCDSMLVYKEPQIVTAKPDKVMLDTVKHNFINEISVTESYDVYKYFNKAVPFIQELNAKGMPLIICGGTGMYFKAVLDGIFTGVSRDPEIRAKLLQISYDKGNEYMHGQLAKVDPESAAWINLNDSKRVIRALEVYEVTGRKMSALKNDRKGILPQISVDCYALDWDRDILYQRINERVERMVEAGAVAEVEALLKMKLSLTARKIISIAELGEYIKGNVSLDEAKDRMKQNTRRYAKRQFTWFKSDKRIKWIKAQGREPEDIAREIMIGCRP